MFAALLLTVLGGIALVRGCSGVDVPQDDVEKQEILPEVGQDSIVVKKQIKKSKGKRRKRTAEPARDLESPLARPI